MRDIDLCTQILGLSLPWKVDSVALDRTVGQLLVQVSLAQTVTLCCPHCGRASAGYDHRVRRWRHLDTCQYETILEAQVPRVRCPEHGVDGAGVVGGCGFGERPLLIALQFNAVSLEKSP